jgi:hypothetical protein
MGGACLRTKEEHQRADELRAKAKALLKKT